jgi:hypothetical protein
MACHVTGPAIPSVRMGAEPHPMTKAEMSELISSSPTCITPSEDCILYL